MNEFEHLSEALDNQEPDEDSLAKISRLGTALQEKLEEKVLLEDELSVLNKQIHQLKQTEIPEAMNTVGVTSFTLKSGKAVAIKEDVSASIKDVDAFYDFLEERGDAALMKIQLEIGKVPKSILAQIVKKMNDEFGILPSTKKGVHPQTLNKYIRELCGIGGVKEAEIPLAELDEEVVKAFTYYKTTIK